MSRPAGGERAATPKRPARRASGGASASSSEPPPLETALTRLEEIVDELEDGELPLEQALRIFEEGVVLSRQCADRLSEAERRVEVLLRDAGGARVPFEDEPEGDD